MLGRVAMDRLYAAFLLSGMGKANVPSALSVMLSAPLARVMLLPLSRPLSVPPMVACTVKAALLETSPGRVA